MEEICVEDTAQRAFDQQYRITIVVEALNLALNTSLNEELIIRHDSNALAWNYGIICFERDELAVEFPTSRFIPIRFVPPANPHISKQSSVTRSNNSMEHCAAMHIDDVTLFKDMWHLKWSKAVEVAS